MTDPTGPEWEAAVESAWDARWQTPGWNNMFKPELRDMLTAALPHLRRHIIAELREKSATDFVGSEAEMVWDWLAAQEEA